MCAARMISELSSREEECTRLMFLHRHLQWTKQSNQRFNGTTTHLCPLSSFQKRAVDLGIVQNRISAAGAPECWEVTFPSHPRLMAKLEDLD